MTTLTIRLKESEKETLEAQARRAGKTKSEFCRDWLRSLPSVERAAFDVDDHFRRVLARATIRVSAMEEERGAEV